MEYIARRWFPHLDLFGHMRTGDMKHLLGRLIIMGTITKLLAAFLLVGFVLVVAVGPTAAAADFRTMACWNNCPIGGDTKTY